MNTFGVIILVALTGQYLLRLLGDILNIRALSPVLPDEFSDVYDDEKYIQAQRYVVTRTRFSIIRRTFNLAVLLVFWFVGGFTWFDRVIRGLGQESISIGFIILGMIFLIVMYVGFRAYSIFVIEARYGFNRTTIRTFIVDLFKDEILDILLVGSKLAIVFVLFEWTGSLAWLWCWIAFIVFTLVVQFISPTWIMPLFNKFTPLEPGDLRNTLIEYAESTRFPIQDIFVIDESRRSSKANAFLLVLAETSELPYMTP